jgi:hypothetical protein
MKFTIGTDPEFMLSQGGKYVSAIPYLVGTKKKPQLLDCGSTLQRDNVALEFATAPATSAEDFVEKISRTLKEVKSIIPKETLLRAVPSARFDRSELEHDEAKEIGCQPDFDAWSGGEPNVPPTEEFEADTLRSCGAHIHAGHSILLPMDSKIKMVQIMDYVVGMPTVPLDSDAAGLERKKLYGRAGCYRPTPYGVEYRTLSNFWLKSPDLVKMVFNLTHDALRIFRDSKFFSMMEIVPPVQVKDAINTGNSTMASKGLKALSEYLSAQSKELLERCLVNLSSYEMEREWA